MKTTTTILAGIAILLGGFMFTTEPDFAEILGDDTASTTPEIQIGEETTQALVDSKRDTLVASFQEGDRSYSKKGNSYDLWISELTPIQSGVEFFVRVSKDGKEFGFGKDGSIETERIRYYYPTGDPVKFEEQVKHVVDEIAKDSGNIKRGSVGRTTSIFSPASGNVSPVDGRCLEDSLSSWPNTVTDTSGRICRGTADTNGSIEALLGNGNGPTTYSMERGIFLFDTSPLPDSDPINSAYLSVYSSVASAYDGRVPTVYLATSSPASDSSLTLTDLDNVGGLILGRLSLDTVTAAGYYDYTLTSTSGLSSILNTGISKYALRSDYDLYTIAPTEADELNAYDISYAEGANDALLVVQHGVSASTTTYPYLIIEGDGSLSGDVIISP